MMQAAAPTPQAPPPAPPPTASPTPAPVSTPPPPTTCAPPATPAVPGELVANKCFNVPPPPEGLQWIGRHPVMSSLIGFVVVVLVGTLVLRRFRRTRAWFARHQFGMIIQAILALFLFIYLTPDVLVSIPSGSVGVLWSRFGGGTVLTQQYCEGTHLISPWNEMFIYDLRNQKADMAIHVLTVEGMSVQINVTLHFSPLDGRVPLLHQAVGPDYLNVLLAPEMQAAVRAVASQMPAEGVYMISTNEVTCDVWRQPQFPLQSQVINLVDILVTNVVLPAQVQQAVQQKLQEEQRIGQMQYRLNVEQLEAQRKTIEAQGIQNFQTIVSAGISPQFLQWKGIDATLALAQSTNAKVVVIGSGKDGLPIILGGLDTTTAGTGGTGGAAAARGGTAGRTTTTSAGPLFQFDTQVPENLAPPFDPNIAPPPGAESVAPAPVPTPTPAPATAAGAPATAPAATPPAAATPPPS